MTSAHTGITFRNDIKNTPEFNIFSYRNFYNGGGVATGDLNNDGLPEVFLTANQGANKLYLNKGDFKFQDISESAGFVTKKDWSTGVVMVDINADGWLDIYECNAGYVDRTPPRNRVWINNRNLGFSDSTDRYNLANTGGYCTHASFLDYDRDGDLDCFIINNSFIPVNTLDYANRRDLPADQWPVADFLKGGGARLMRNDGGTYKEVTREAGVYNSLIGFGLGITTTDVNGDGWMDVYVSNDFFERDYLYINQQNGKFKESYDTLMQHGSLASMGSDAGDLTNDGAPEIFTTDMLPADNYRLRTTTVFDNWDVYQLKLRNGFGHQYMQNALQLNDGNGSFSEVACYAGVEASDWSWGALLFDADSDGWNDIYVSNGIYNDLTDQDFINFFADEVNRQKALHGERAAMDSIIARMPSRPIADKAFRNRGNLRFEDAGDRWGFDDKSFSNGAAYADLDGDGDLDLVVNNVSEEAFVYRNRSREDLQRHYIGFRIVGTGQNTKVIGTRIVLKTATGTQLRELQPARGFQSSVDYTMLFGLGDSAQAVTAEISFPDGSHRSISELRADSVYTVRATDGAPSTPPPPAASRGLMASLPSPFAPHVENEYTDFYDERLLPRMLSREGPKAATADVNGDGLEDIYICGSAQVSGMLYLQNATGGYTPLPQPAMARFAGWEEGAAAFFDYDRDGDADLFIGAGGNESRPHSERLTHRLYDNDGSGNFSLSSTRFPPNASNISCALPHDWDADGDLDLYVGGRNITGDYGASPKSYLYQNDGKGGFTDVATGANAAVGAAGMITAAVWTDVTGDGRAELVLVGEWMAPQIFGYEKGVFKMRDAGLSGYEGWWQTVEASDLDGDGDADMVLGNIGENFTLRPDSLHPVQLHLADFDGNGVQDKVITQRLGDKNIPVFMKRELEDAMPGLRKKNLLFKDFGNQGIEALFSETVRKKATVLNFRYGASAIAWNEGGGKFTLQKLPPVVQYSSVSSITVCDANGDGKRDILGGGNFYAFLPQFARLDAGRGFLLLGAGNRRWLPQNAVASGLDIKGEVRDIVPLRQKGEPDRFLFLRNNMPSVVYRFTKGGNP